MKHFYAVHRGRRPGIYSSWTDCKSQVHKFEKALFKKCSSESDAHFFVTRGYLPTIQSISSPQTYHQTTLDSFFKKHSSVSTISSQSSLREESSSRINVYTDGSCHHNGKVYAKAGMGVYFGPDDPRNVSRRITGKQTNNRAELLAIIEVFSILQKEIQEKQSVHIYTDSKYSIRCATTYGRKLYSNSWKPLSSRQRVVPNLKLVKQLYLLIQKYHHVKLHHIRAHTNAQDVHSQGNEQADHLANCSIQSSK